jgi:hypothetical protein
MMPLGGVRHIDQKLIQRSAWNGSSPKFVLSLGYCQLVVKRYKISAL